MSIREETLKILEENRGADVSGAEIARRLGVSRSAVWKAVSALKADGHTILAGTNRGYCLAAESGALSVPEIQKHLKTPCTLVLKKAVTSTNDVAKDLAEEGAAEWTVVIAREQTAGKGRQGRQFYSPADTGIYMSIVLRPAFPPAQALLITTAAAVAVAQALEQLGCPDPAIKWVNDVYSGGKKVCGILTEGAFDFESGRFRYAVLGIGINLSAPAGGFPGELRERAGAAFAAGEPLKNRLAAAVIDNFARFYAALPEKPHLALYRQRSMLTGKTVLIPGPKGERTAQALGIDDDFRLLVASPDGTREALSSGEVSVKLFQ